MPIVSKFKKSLATVFTTAALLLMFTTPTSAATFGPYDITSYLKNDYGGVTADLGSGVDKITIDLKQWGIHSGQKADIYYRVSRLGGSESYMKRVQGDGTATLVFDNLRAPGADYSISWLSNTDYDLDGWYKVIISSGTVFK